MSPRQLLRSAARQHVKPVLRRALGALAGALAPLVPPPNQLQGIEAVLRSTDEVLLALARSGGLGRRTGPATPVVLGERILWLEHPRAPFHLLDARDLRDTPSALAGGLRPHLHELLERLLEGVDRAVELGAHQGVHTVTLARRLQGRGRIVVADTSARGLVVARENLTAHGLDDGASCFVVGEEVEASPFRDAGVVTRVSTIAALPLEGWGLLKADASLLASTPLDRLLASAAGSPRLLALDVTSAHAAALAAPGARGLSLWRVHHDGRLELTSPVALSELRHPTDVLLASAPP